MKAQSTIPIYNLQERAKGNFKIIKPSDSHDFKDGYKAHRDNNYLLIFQEYGQIKAMVDFQEITISGTSIFCILPGQIHYGISWDQSALWVMAIDPAWIKDIFRTMLMEFAIGNIPITITPPSAALLQNSLQLLYDLDEYVQADISSETKYAMLDVCLGLFVSNFQYDHKVVSHANLRPALITRQFRSLLLVNFREVKSPAEYASMLNISPSYLNEVVKDTTGHPVSYWIHQEIMMEAKRLLFYSNRTVKEIANHLGYSDVTYFIRLFGKVAGLAPLKFRNKYHK